MIFIMKKHNIMKQLFNPEELVGKTIEKFIIDVEECEDWWIKFTDNSFVILSVRNLARASYEHKEAIAISDDKPDNTFDELLKLGLITEVQHEEANKKSHEENAKKSAAETLLRQQQIEKTERETFAKLKKKYGEI